MQKEHGASQILACTRLVAQTLERISVQTLERSTV